MLKFYYKIFFLFFLFNSFTLFFPFKTNGKEKGEKLFEMTCNTCHPNSSNIIIPEKTLTIEVLEKNGIGSSKNLTYLILNGKNGMPSFHDRLKEIEIEEISNYLLQEKNKE